MTVKRFALVVLTASALVIGGAVALPDHACDSKDKAATTASATAEAPTAQTADLKAAADKPGCAKPCDKAAMAAKGENAPCHKADGAAAVTAEGAKAPCAAAKAAGAGCPKKAAAAAVVAQNAETPAEAEKAPEAK